VASRRYAFGYGRMGRRFVNLLSFLHPPVAQTFLNNFNILLIMCAFSYFV
jgi:hypothetical protein